MKDVYDIQDLRNDALPANTKLAVIGYPIQHSASPQMHQAALDALHLDIKYIRIEVPPGSVAEAFKLMKNKGFLGCNVTVPHKLEAMQACDQLSDSVHALGAANTIIFQNDKILGHNTDGPGLVKALKEDLNFTVRGSNILVLGAGGGAGRAIATQLAMEGCSKLYLSNRTISKVEVLAKNLAQYPATTCACLDNAPESLSEIARQVSLIVNATSLGMQKEDHTPFPISALTSQHKIYDAIYNPAETELLRHAGELGVATANGLSMLVHQGALSFKKWTKSTPNIQLMKAAIS